MGKQSEVELDFEPSFLVSLPVLFISLLLFLFLVGTCFAKYYPWLPYLNLGRVHLVSWFRA